VADIEVGDVLVKDYPGTGRSAAHIEVVTGTSPLRVTGAHYNGAYERTDDWFAGATYNANRSHMDARGNEIYILRPHARADG
jgi:hypothetical protein